MMGQKEIEKLVQAIAALEAQRQTVGDPIIDTALAPIREKLATLRAAAKSESYKGEGAHEQGTYLVVVGNFQTARLISR